MTSLDIWRGEWGRGDAGVEASTGTAEAEGDASTSALSDWELAFCGCLPMEEHPQRRICSFPCVQKMRRIVDEGGCELILRGHRKHTPPPIFPCERRRAAESRGRRLAVLLRQVAEKLAGCVAPATSDFACEGHQLGLGVRFVGPRGPSAAACFPDNLQTFIFVI